MGKATYNKETYVSVQAVQIRLMTPHKVPITFLKTKRDLQNPQLSQFFYMLMLNLEYSILAAKRNPKGILNGHHHPFQTKVNNTSLK